MSTISFKAPEYQPDGSFVFSEFNFSGNETDGWDISKNGTIIQKLGPGYAAVESLCCGVCSTDLARKFLPYPLPQVIGHEVVGRYLGKNVTIEINASHKARNIQSTCSFCKNGLDTQCPERITLGIDRLPGGFSPWFLAPVNSIIEIPESVSVTAASLTEPFAAALHAVEASSPVFGKVAVLGPRRLGMLIIGALSGYRRKGGYDFEIHAVVRHPELTSLALEMGADNCIDISRRDVSTLKDEFDMVFDTTGNPDGFSTALDMSVDCVHLKSTNGRSVLGLDHLTDMVVDEISLLPFESDSFEFSWPSDTEKRINSAVYVSESIESEVLNELKSAYPEKSFYQMSIEQALEKIQNENFFPSGALFPRFDLAVCTSLKEIDAILRPLPGKEISLVRPRGAILLKKEENFESQLDRSIAEKGIRIHTSRCGDFKKALNMMKENPTLCASLEKMVSHRFVLEQIQSAFETAADSRMSVKVLVETSAESR